MTQSKIKFSFAFYISILFICFMIWVIYMANTGQNNILFQFIREIPHGDKLGHFFLFGIFTFVLNIGIGNKTCFNNKFLLGTVFILLFAIVEETSQYWITTRTLDGIDLIADISGIILFDGMAKRYLNIDKN